MKTERQHDQEVAERLRRENLDRVEAGGCAPPVLAVTAPKDNEVDEKVIWSDDLAAVLEAASEASAVPLTWFANREFSPEQTKAWLCDAVDNTVEGGTFSGELHSIAEEDSGLTVAFTGCGPKSGANAKFLIWCAHFILKHREALSDHAATVAELRAEVERLRAALHIETHKVITCGVAASHPDASLSRRMEYAGKWDSPQAQDVRKLRDRADAAERRVGELEAFVTAVRTECFDYYNEGIRPWPHHMQTLAWKADEVLEHATLTGADPT